jgi:hypothetical protein
MIGAGGKNCKGWGETGSVMGASRGGREKEKEERRRNRSEA